MEHGVITFAAINYLLSVRYACLEQEAEVKLTQVTAFIDKPWDSK